MFVSLLKSVSWNYHLWWKCYFLLIFRPACLGCWEWLVLSPAMVGIHINATGLGCSAVTCQLSIGVMRLPYKHSLQMYGTCDVNGCVWSMHVYPIFCVVPYCFQNWKCKMYTYTQTHTPKWSHGIVHLAPRLPHSFSVPYACVDDRKAW